jgi:aryl-alcohol dehydrogenase-like predicted oxidoreductase
LHAAADTLLIPGTASRAHLRQNLRASTLRLDAEAIRELSDV